MMYNHVGRAAKFITVYIENFDNIDDEYKYQFLEYMQNRLKNLYFKK